MGQVKIARCQLRDWSAEGCQPTFHLGLVFPKAQSNVRVHVLRSHVTEHSGCSLYETCSCLLSRFASHFPHPSRESELGMVSAVPCTSAWAPVDQCAALQTVTECL